MLSICEVMTATIPCVCTRLQVHGPWKDYAIDRMNYALHRVTLAVLGLRVRTTLSIRNHTFCASFNFFLSVY